MTTAVGGITSQLAALTVKAGKAGAVVSQLAGLVVYAPPSTRYSRVSQSAALVPYAIGKFTVPRTSQFALLITYSTASPDESMSRAWTFTLDGHTFYVLDLGVEGTFLYDIITDQWCKFITDGYNGWNFKNGVQWQQDRIVAGDSQFGIVWELDPTAVLDEGWRDIHHTVTAMINLRTRVFVACDALRLQTSIGQLDDVNGTTMTMQFSDDQGQTWSREYTIDLSEGTFNAEIAWRSLGSFMAPGRVFQITDIGGTIRIDGADVFLNGFDSDNVPAGDMDSAAGG